MDLFCIALDIPNPFSAATCEKRTRSQRVQECSEPERITLQFNLQIQASQ